MEQQRYRLHPEHFIKECCKIHDKATGRWLPFSLWPAQHDILDAIRTEKAVVVLKCRQIGATWMALAYILWLLVFHKVTVLLFSQRDDEAQELMDRLTNMHARLPDGMRPKATVSNGHELQLEDGGQALAFPTTKRAGRSYTGAFALVDEADFIEDLPALLNAMQPAVDAGGQLVLLSTSDKSKPESIFKKIYLNAVAGANEYSAIFHGWAARPGRTPDWYAAKVRASLANTGALDDVYQEYPATADEALAPRSLDKRLPYAWLKKCFVQSIPVLDPKAPAIPGLKVYRPPEPGRKYVVGADPAAGNPTSDDSAAEFLDAETAEEVAVLCGKFEPVTFAAHIDQIGRWYNMASVMPETNNHGAVVIAWLQEHGSLPVLKGLDDKPGWTTTTKSKPILYGMAGEVLRDGECLIHDLSTLNQLAGVEGSTLKAPEGQFDDRAVAWCLAIKAVIKARGQVWIFGGSDTRKTEFRHMPGGDPTLERLEGGWGEAFGGGE